MLGGLLGYHLAFVVFLIVVYAAWNQLHYVVALAFDQFLVVGSGDVHAPCLDLVPFLLSHQFFGFPFLNWQQALGALRFYELKLACFVIHLRHVVVAESAEAGDMEHVEALGRLEH